MTQEYFYRREIIELLNCDEDFLELLETEDLVRPLEAHSEDEDAFSIDDVERIRVSRVLVRELEVNLPGVEVILQMRESMMRMQEQFDQILEALAEELKRRK